MTLGRMLLKIVKWSLVSVFALATASYLLLLAVNWNDRPPSEAALKFQRSVDSRPAVPDRDNAFVYAHGFDVARHLDPAEWGKARLDWAEAIAGNLSLDSYDNFPGEKSNFRAQRGERIQSLASACHRKPGAECYAALENAAELPEQWLARESWVLERYRALISFPAWREQIPVDVAAPFPPYQDLLEGQQLLHLKVWQLAGSGDGAGVRDLLEDDIHFWRMILVNTDILLTKMIAAAAIERHFSRSNLAFRRLPVEEIARAIPESWRQPLTDPELSLERSIIGEWLFSNNIVDVMKAGDGAAWEDRPFSRFMDRLFSPMFQPQDTSNRHAEALLAISEKLRVPIEEIPRALDDLEETSSSAADTQIGLYNPVGSMLLRMGYSAYADYAARIADLEGARRVALLTAQLRRATATDPVQIQQRLKQSDLRNPYTGEPFAWDKESGAIVFAGLASGERGRHAFLY